jgi:hypothetical protein
MIAEQRVRVQPRMSASKLGEYLEAKAPRRETILRDQKYPAAFKTARYQLAHEEIRRALLQEGNVHARLAEGARRVSEKRGATRFEDQSISCSGEAVERFAALYERLRLDDVQMMFAGQPTFAVRMEGVNISARPLVLLERCRHEEVHLGALLLVLRKEKALTEHSGEAVAQLMRSALSASELATRGSIRPEFCIVVDVFGASIFRAPTRNKRALEEIRSACREISAHWPFIAGVRAA